jgi:general secretion pathway protein H
VVLVILGVVVAMIAVNFAPDPCQNLDTEAQRLALLLEQARDEAMTSGSGIAFSAEGRGYRFWQREAQAVPDAVPDKDWPGKEWKPHADSEVFRPRELPPTLAVTELLVSQQPAARIIFAPSGMALPFRLTLASGSYRVAVGGNGMGQIAVEKAP